jgi:hypothetical protein
LFCVQFYILEYLEYIIKEYFYDTLNVDFQNLIFQYLCYLFKYDIYNLKKQKKNVSKLWKDRMKKGSNIAEVTKVSSSMAILSILIK